MQENRRSYRESFYTAQIGMSISGVILFKEALQQKASDGTSFVECLNRQGNSIHSLHPMYPFMLKHLH